MTVIFQRRLSILRRKQVEARTGLSRSTIYDRLNPKSPRHDPSFPKQISLGEDAVGWIEAEVDAWIAARVRASRNCLPAPAKTSTS